MSSSQMKYLSRKRRLAVLVLLTLGISTFFAPLIVTDPPVEGSTQWSVFDLLRWSMLPDSHNPPHVRGDRSFHGFWNTWIQFGSIYPIMIITLVGLGAFPLQGFVTAMGITGSITSFANLQTNIIGNPDIQIMLYRDPRIGRVSCGGLWAVLLTVMVIVTLISWSDNPEGGGASHNEGSNPCGGG